MICLGRLYVWVFVDGPTRGLFTAFREKFAVASWFVLGDKTVVHTVHMTKWIESTGKGEYFYRG
jgi:hypothetical protein